jgi:hypothetical protein
MERSQSGRADLGRPAAVIEANTSRAATAAIDMPLALAIVGLGTLIIIAPSSVPGLMPPM